MKTYRWEITNTDDEPFFLKGKNVGGEMKIIYPGDKIELSVDEIPECKFLTFEDLSILESGGVKSDGRE